jgi:hypothetical protein
MYFYGSEAEIDLDQHVEKEFSDFDWRPLEGMPNEVRAALLIMHELPYATWHYVFHVNALFWL